MPDDDLAARGHTTGAEQSSRTAGKALGLPFIVAEVSKNWIDGHPANGDPVLLSQLFERVINVNAMRGYRLHSFQIDRFDYGSYSHHEVNELRRDVANGAGHECSEWWDARGRCALCDRAKAPASTNALDPSAQPSGTPTPRATFSSSFSVEDP